MIILVLKFNFYCQQVFYRTVPDGRT